MRSAAFFALALALWLLVIPQALTWVVPGERWLEVRGVFVDDGVIGGPLAVTPDRTIHRDFRGHWTAYVRRAEGGGFSLFCRRASPEPFDYRAGASIPADANLDWWLEVPPNAPCAWTPGQYRMTTVWTIHGPLNAKFEVSADSNVFTIRAQHEGACDGIRATRRGVYHVPGSRYYDAATDPVECFDTIDQAEGAGYRPAGETP